MQSMRAGHSSYFVTTYIKIQSTKEGKRKEREKRRKRKEENKTN